MEGKIIYKNADLFKVYSSFDNKIYESKATKLFKLKKEELKVGDHVEFNIIENDKAYITALLPRKNTLIRPFISNVDMVIVANSVKEPFLNTNLLDRILTILEHLNIEAIILFTKWDLLEKNELDELNDVFNYYQKIGYKTFKSSLNDIPSEIYDLIKGKVVVVAGQSGVGKSSFLNNLESTWNLSTNEISKALNRGKHTTRHVELLRYKDTWIADTPGFGTLAFTDMEEIDISYGFVEFFKYSKECKYNGCLHINEPKCEVINKLNENEILKSRYINYRLFIDEVKNNRKW